MKSSCEEQCVNWGGTEEESLAGFGGGLDLGVREEGVTVDLWNSHVGN